MRNKLIFIITTVLFVFYFATFTISLFAQSFEDFANELNSETNHSTYLDFGSGGNVATTDIQTPGIDGQIGTKTDCTGIELGIDVAGFISDLTNNVGSILEDYQNIMVVNGIINTLAYSAALITCAEDLPKDIALGPVAQKALSETKECILSKVGDSTEVESDAQGGVWWNPSGSCKHPPCLEPWGVSENKVSVKADKIASASYCNYSKLKETLGDDFIKCIDTQKDKNVKFITDILNSKLTANLQVMFNLREECIINQEQVEYDLIQMFQDAYGNGNKSKNVIVTTPTGQKISITDSRAVFTKGDDPLPIRGREQVVMELEEDFWSKEAMVYVYNTMNFNNTNAGEYANVEYEYIKKNIKKFKNYFLPNKQDDIYNALNKCKNGFNEINKNIIAYNKEINLTMYKIDSNILSQDTLANFIIYRDMLEIVNKINQSYCSKYLNYYAITLANYISKLTSIENSKTYQIDNDIFKQNLEVLKTNQEIIVKHFDVFKKLYQKNIRDFDRTEDFHNKFLTQFMIEENKEK